jgi:hypothetical protein
MTPDLSFRSFKAGSWDLRKRERRERQLTIEFSDRRGRERRGAADEIDRSEIDRDVTWVSKPALDE